MKQWIAVMWIVLFASPAIADKQINSYRCGNGLIQMGISLSEAKRVCGNKRPDNVRNWTREYSNGFTTWTRSFRGWVFRDYGKFTVMVVFNQGSVIEIIQTNDRN